MNTSVGTSNTANEVIPLSFLCLFLSLPRNDESDKNFLLPRGGKNLATPPTNQLGTKLPSVYSTFIGEESLSEIKVGGPTRSPISPEIIRLFVGLAEDGGKGATRDRRDTSATVGGGYARGRYAC